ncbi:MAG: exodeoxyribonuclease VII large subunit [Candidatus Thermoplasmatota archaeon]
MKGREIFTVSELTKYLKRLLAKDETLTNVWVSGEVSNFKLHSSGHIYFVLKDEFAQLKCVIFRERASNIKFEIMDGRKVFAHGYVSIYEGSGIYQLYVVEVEPAGIGSLYLAFEELKKRLETEGLFDKARKRPIPFFPKMIGVVTSPTGAVFQDIVNIVKRRCPHVKVVLAPVKVQGIGAAEEIAMGIRQLNEIEGIEVIIACRGGGSLEELWAFNEETVARAIFSSKVPIISAVGHETDFTISDFVADLRAPTPSAAAELVVPEKQQLIALINNLKNRLNSEIDALLKEKRQRLDEAFFSLDKAIRNELVRQKERWKRLTDILSSLSPYSVLSRGYSITLREIDKKIIKNISDVEIGEKIKIILCDGKIGAEVKSKEGENEI